MEPKRDGWRPEGRCPIFVCDIISYGHPTRTDRMQVRLRSGMYAVVRAAFGRSGLDLDGCYYEDRGDSVIVVPSVTDPLRLVFPLLDHLRGELRAHNELVNDVLAIRLRVAVDLGWIAFDGEGLVGTTVNHVHRLIDAGDFKAACADTNALLGLIVSPEVYDLVVREGNGAVHPDDFRQVEVAVKETTETAWMRLLGTEPAALAATAPPPDRSAGSWAGAGADRRPFDLFELADLLLTVPIMAMPGGRDQVLASLPSHIALRVARRPQAHLDTCSIIQTCLDFPGGLVSLLHVVREYAGPSATGTVLESMVDRWVQSP